MVNVNDARPPLLEARNLTFGYDARPIFSNLSLTVRSGEMLGLLGPNGSGKSTLLRVLTGVLAPQKGSVILRGRELSHWGRRGVARQIAVVPQELHMPFAFTVEHMVSLGRTPFVSLLGALDHSDRAIIADALQATEIADLAGRVFNELSGGERQRVLLAMALAQQPGLLLLDEPTAHLDIKYQIEMLELVQRLNRERGVTIVAALHDLNLAARYFPRLVLFQRGIIADAAPAEVLEPGLLRRVYGVEVQVGILHGAEYLSVLPPGRQEHEREHGNGEQARPRVFVMAGGGSGALLMRALADARVRFIAGALNIGDSDHALALRLAAEVIAEQPYAPLSPAVLAQVRACLAQAELLLICPFYVGPGNLALLQEAVVAARRGLRVLLLAPPEIARNEANAEMDALQLSGIAARDYANGEGCAYVRQLLQAGAGVVSSVREALAACSF